MGFWNEIFDTNFSIIISIQLQENKNFSSNIFLIHNIFFFASAAEGPDINFCSSIISNFFLTKPTLQSVFKSYHRPSVLGESTAVFTYNYVQKNFSPNRPYRPSLSQNENRPSLGGESTVHVFQVFLEILHQSYVKTLRDLLGYPKRSPRP